MLYFSFFFFKQKTAYEMRISDWSSDVCSSDLVSSAGGSAQSPLLAEMRVNLCRKRLTPDPAPAKGCPTESGHLHILSRGTYDTARTSARQRDPRACDGRRTGREQRPSRDADGHGRRRHRALFRLSEVRSERSEMGRSRPIRPLGGAWLDARLCDAASGRLCAAEAADRK